MFNQSLKTAAAVTAAIAAVFFIGCGDNYTPSGDGTIPAFTTKTLPGGTVGTTYSQTIKLSGGIPPFTWSIDAGGALPGGLTISNDGTISGTPTTEGTFNFTVKVVGEEGGALKDYSIVIAPGAGGGGGGNIVGDWEFVAWEDEDTGKFIPDFTKIFFTYSPNGDVSWTQMEKVSDFWISASSPIGDILYIIRSADSLLYITDNGTNTIKYKLLGDTLTLTQYYDDDGEFYIQTLVRVNLDSVTQSLGIVHKEDPKLVMTGWQRASTSGGLDILWFEGNRVYDDNGVYIQRSENGYNTWYTNGATMTLLSVVCGAGYGEYHDECPSSTITQQRMFDYELKDGNLHLKPAGQSVWVEWEPDEDYDMLGKSRAGSAPKARFWRFGGRF